MAAVGTPPTPSICDTYITAQKCDPPNGSGRALSAARIACETLFACLKWLPVCPYCKYVFLTRLDYNDFSYDTITYYDGLKLTKETLAKRSRSIRRQSCRQVAPALRTYYSFSKSVELTFHLPSPLGFRSHPFSKLLASTRLRPPLFSFVRRVS